MIFLSCYIFHKKATTMQWFAFFQDADIFFIYIKEFSYTQMLSILFPLNYISRELYKIIFRDVLK